MNMLRRALALEEASDGQANLEIEHVFYARLPDRLELHKAASSEHQEQWEIKVPKTAENAGSGWIRIRKTIEQGKNPQYVLTTKTVSNKGGDRIEVPVPTTIANFEQFRLMSNRGMLKDRYFFPIDGTEMVWEVDMFYLPGAEPGSLKYYEWCKIDLEVSDRTTAIPPLPIAFEQLITAPFGKRTTQEEEIVNKLYDEVFVTKNVHLQGV